VAGSLDPQNAVAFGIPGIRSGLQEAVSSSECSSTISNLLNGVANSKNPLVKTDNIMAMFESVLSGTGAFTRERPPGSLGHGSPM
jgi:hypothetical protein